MAITYFGYTSIGGSVTAPPGVANWARNKGYVTDYTCPGSGNQAVKELALYSRSNGGTPENIRLAIYDRSHNLICQGSAVISVNSTTGQWWTHTTFSGTAILVGGTGYDLAAGVATGADAVFYYDTLSAGDFTYGLANYTTGFPASLADGTDTNRVFSIRCGVEPAPQTLSPSAIASAEAFGTQALHLHITLAGIASAETIGGPALHFRISPQAIASAEAFGLAVLSIAGGLQTLSPIGIDSDESFGTATTILEIVAQAIASGELVGTGRLDFVIPLEGVPGEEAFGLTVVTGGEAVAEATIVRIPHKRPLKILNQPGVDSGHV